MPLPPGLGLNSLTGQISGVPTTPGVYNFTLRVRDAQGVSVDLARTITVNAYTPPSLSGTLTQFSNRSVAYSSGLTRANGSTPFVWSISSGTLPVGITINTSTGVISGTPTDTSYTDRSITVRVADSQLASAQSNQTIRYADTLALTGTLATGTQSTAYSSGFTRAGGHSGFTFVITAGSLPPGLTMDTSTGLITGTPTTTSSGSITIRVTDAAGAQVSRTGTLTINSSYVQISITGSVSGATQNVETLSSFTITPNYSAVVVSGGNSNLYTYSWARISGSTAIDAGAPASFGTTFVGSVAPAGNVNAVFRCTVTDGTSSATFDASPNITNTYVALGLTASVPVGTRTVAYSGGLTRTGGSSPFTFAVISGTLPTGISINSGSGALSGTPTDTGYTTRSLTFRVTDNLGATEDVSDSLVYRNFPSISYSLAAGMRTRAYSSTPTLTSGGHTVTTVALTAGTLPAGLTLASPSGVISGTPTGTSYGSIGLTFQVTDAAGNAASTSPTLLYQDNITIAGTLPGGMNGSAYSSTALSASGGHGGNAWSIASGSLPTGLSINSSTGAVTGTPTVTANNSFTVRVTDNQGFTADSAQSVNIVAALAVSPGGGAFAVFNNNPPSSSPSTRTLTTNTTTASASGGTPGYTYAWTRVSGSTLINADSPSAAATTFTADVPIGPLISAVFRVTATDAASATATADIDVELIYESTL